MVLDSAAAYGELVPEVVSGIRVERWQRTVARPQTLGTAGDSRWPVDCFWSAFMSDDRSIKATGSVHAPSRTAPKQAFGEVLKQQPKPGTAKPLHPAAASGTGKPAQHPPPLPKAGARTASTLTGIRSTTATAVAPRSAATAENLSQARSEMHVEAGRLREVRTELHANNEQKMDARLLDLIVKELSNDLPAEAASAKPATNANAADGAHAKLAGIGGHGADHASSNAEIAAPKVDASTVASAKAQAAAALVERIEAFVKSNRPALAVTLGGAINARVEVERTGPGEVALRVQGTKGPPPAEDLARIRDAVKARGLKLSSLSVG